jgi:hypothetical protein
MRLSKHGRHSVWIFILGPGKYHELFILTVHEKEEGFLISLIGKISS